MDYCAIQILKAEIKLVWKVNISKLNSSNCRGENFFGITRKTLIFIYRYHGLVNFNSFFLPLTSNIDYFSWV